MPTSEVIQIARELILTALVLTMPVILVSLVVGLEHSGADPQLCAANRGSRHRDRYGSSVEPESIDRFYVADDVANG